MTRWRFVISICLIFLLALACLGQWYRGRRSYRQPDRSDYPTWEIDGGFKSDVFTFVRIRYDSYISYRDFRWDNDYPDGDWNFSYRLQELTSLKVDPDGKVLRLSDPRLFDYPFVYLLGTRGFVLSDLEVESLRRYLLNGGFLMVDDFWGVEEWSFIYEQMKRVFPEREPTEITLDHEIFHIVYDLDELPQVTSIQAWREGVIYEYWHGDPGGDEGPHFRGIFDNQNRLMVLLCHNNDLGDGWEREGETTDYFERFSERWSYPMGINIITYVMTH